MNIVGFRMHGNEMIKALTDLEVIQVGSNKRPLSNKENSLKSNITDRQSINSMGLAAFVEEKEFWNVRKMMVVN